MSMKKVSIRRHHTDLCEPLVLLLTDDDQVEASRYNLEKIKTMLAQSLMMASATVQFKDYVQSALNLVQSLAEDVYYSGTESSDSEFDAQLRNWIIVDRQHDTDYDIKFHIAEDEL